jgi:hydroxyacylglutathione hydrolase
LNRLYESDEFDIWGQTNDLINCNTFLVWFKELSHAVVIDPGSNPQSVVDQIRNFDVSKVDVFLTHGHFDHVLGVKPLSRIFDTRVFMNPKDVKHLKRNNFYLRALHLKYNVESFDHEPFPVDDERLRHIKVIDAPGHTEGSVLFSVGPCIFVGDLLMSRIVFSATVPGHDKTKWAQTINDVWPILKNHERIFLGHGEPIVPNELLANNDELRNLLRL